MPARPAHRSSAVLLVDDADDLRTLYRIWLERTEEFQVVAEAANGLEGLHLAKAHQPDLVLLDISMPVMDGLEALPLIAQACQSTIVVMVTAISGAPGLKGTATALGNSGYIVKGTPMPVVLGDLRAIIARQATTTAPNSTSPTRPT
jgi:DNA-binding NarL/FixJ family response regulator